MLEQKTGHCIIAEREVTVEDIAYFLQNQKNIVTTNKRFCKSDAFEIALDGSKAYLQAWGYLEN